MTTIAPVRADYVSANQTPVDTTAKKTQVMCISHLGQVAIQGDHHYLIKKVVENNTTTSNIKELSSDEAINEIAKMVSGGSVDKASIELVKSWK